MLAAAFSGLPAPSPVRAQAQVLLEVPHITVTPDCGPAPLGEAGDTITVTVRGFSFTPRTTVTLALQGTVFPPPGDAVPVSDFGTFEATANVVRSSFSTSWEVGAYYAPAQIDSSSPVARTFFSSPCQPKISLTPDCGDAGIPTSIHVSGSGFLSGFQFQARVTNGSTDLFVSDPLTLDANAVAIDIPFTPPAAGVYDLVVGQIPPPGVELFLPSAQASFVAPCPSLTVTPTCAEAGGPDARYAIQLSGSGFVPFRGLEFYFDPAGVNQRFYWDFSVPETGTWGPVEIQPYKRGPAVYEILVRQAGETGIVHDTRVSLTVPCATPTVTLDITCASPQFVGDEQRSFALNVQGTEFESGGPIVVTFDPDLLSGPEYVPETAQGSAASDGSFTAPMTIFARPAGSYRVRVQQQQRAGLLEVNGPLFLMPCSPSSPTLNVRPICDREAPGESAAYSIRVAGRGYIPGFVEVIFDAGERPKRFPHLPLRADAFKPTSRPTAGRPASIASWPSNVMFGRH